MLKKVSDLIKDTSLLSSQNAMYANTLIVEAWKETHIIDEDTKKNAKIRMIKNNTIYITASSGIWAQEIQLRSDQILQSINTAIKTKTTFQLKQLVVFAGEI